MKVKSKLVSLITVSHFWISETCSISVFVPIFTEMRLGVSWVGGCSGGPDWRRWVNTAGDTQLWWVCGSTAPFTHLSVCLLRGCALIFTRWSLCEAFTEAQQAGMKVTLSTNTASLIPLWINLNVLLFMKVYKGHLWICLCVAQSLCGWDGPGNID